MIAVRHRLMPAALGVGVAGRTAGRVGVTVGVVGVDRYHMLVDVVSVRVVEMPLVEVIDMVVMTHRGVAARLVVDVGVAPFVNGMRHGHTVPPGCPSAKQCPAEANTVNGILRPARELQR